MPSTTHHVLLLLPSVLQIWHCHVLVRPRRTTSSGNDAPAPAQ